MTARRSLLVLALSLACFLGVAAGAGAAMPGGATNFKVPACGDLAPAAAEGVLVPLCAGQTIGGLGTLLPSGELLKRPLPGGAGGPFAAGPAGEIWAGTGSGGTTLGIDRIAADGTVTTFALRTAQEYDTLQIDGLVPDGPGSAWIAIGELAPEPYFYPFDSLGGELVHIAADGTVTRFPVPEGVEPQALVRGPDGNLWFAGESGRFATEHTSYLGKGYVGRMTPQGEFALFPTAIEESAPGGIAVGPDGRLWFTETSNRVNEVGTIGTDGVFGPSLQAGYLDGPIAFGPEGNVWLSVLGGVARITPKGQHTVFPLPEAQGVVVGAEGDIWTRQFKTVQRIVPGAPGIDTWKIEADRRSKTVHVQLACGGSERGCRGILTLSLSTRESGTKPGARLARAAYKVAPESQRELTIHLSAKALALARSAVPKRAGAAYVGPIVVQATVAGGPTLDRRFYAPGLVAK
jgi:streptogramin lyase